MTQPRLFCYQQMPVWDNQTLPDTFRKKHNTEPGVWARLVILRGQLEFAFLTEDGDVVTTDTFTADKQPPLIEPQCWHRMTAISGDIQCQLSFYCQAEDYYAHKYELTTTHSEVVEAVQQITPCKVLDLGCGGGRNSLYLNLLGFEVDACDYNENSLDRLQQIIASEQLKNIRTAVYDINQAALTEQYDWIISTVVLMFLSPDRIPAILGNMQTCTRSGGYNLIVAPIDSQDYPCSAPFPFLLKPGELQNYYQDWTLLKYNENPGEMHRRDEYGNRVKLRFATLLARKP